MLIMETEAKIRRLYHVEGQSIKAIVKQLNLARNTIRSVLRSGKAGRKYKRTIQVKPQLSPFIDQLERWLDADSLLCRRKDRRTAMKYFTDLQSKGYLGSYDSVQRYVKAYSGKKRKLKQAFIPLSFDPAEAYQFDWSDEIVEINGVVVSISVAHFRLSYSRKFFVVAYPRQAQEIFFDAHNRAFSFFGGLTQRGIYDNLKTAVDKIIKGKDRRYNQRFLALMDHYLIEPVACTPAAGWEKGQVEKQVNNVRDWLFKPRLKFNSYSALNEYLAKRCQAIAEQMPHPTKKSHTIESVYQEERSILRPMGSLFDSYRSDTLSVSSTCLVTFDNNQYSAPCEHANEIITIQAYHDRLVILAKGIQVASHQRCFDRNKRLLDPWHYLPLLERKPGALRNGLPFKDWELPESILSVKEILMKKKGGDKEAVAILMAMQTYGVEAVSVSCELALTEKIISRDYVLNAVSRLNEANQPEEIELPSHLKLNMVPMADCARYDQLRGGLT